jgi:hypothetical protein
LDARYLKNAFSLKFPFLSAFFLFISFYCLI